MFRGTFSGDSLNIDDQFQFHIRKQVPDFLESGDNAIATYPTMYLVVPDGETMSRLYEYQYSVYGEEMASSYQTWLGFDLDCNADTQIELTKQLYDQFAEGSETHPNFYYEIKGLETQRYSFYSLFGGLLFLGILLSVVFLFGTVLIMYYKQISEGYEDAARFEILQKVGMTRKEIKKEHQFSDTDRLCGAAAGIRRTSLLCISADPKSCCSCSAYPIHRCWWA